MIEPSPLVGFGAWSLALVPLVGGAVVWALGRRRVTPGLAIGALVATLGLGVWAAAAQSEAGFAWGGRLGLSLEVAGISRLMAVLVPAIALPVVAYAASSLASDRGLARLLGLLVAFVGAMELLVTAADFLTLLIGWELVAACSWALIGHGWQSADGPPAATQAFVSTRFGDLGLYLAAGAAYAGGGSFSFAALAGGTELDVVAAGLVLATAAKSAQLPFAPWLFSAMAGPTPVSALLHSATMVAAGAYALAKLAPAFEPVSWFGPGVAVLGLATALAGGVVAAVQTDLKKALAASTSAQYGLILVAVGAGSTTAAGSHLLTHAAFKSLLFLGAGVAIHTAGSGHLARMRLGAAERVAALLFGIGALALAAVPPLGAAFSKEAVVAAALHRSAWLGAGVLAAGLVSAFYATRLQLLAFGRPRRSHAPGQAGTVSTAELGAMGLLGGATVVLGGLWLPGGRHILERALPGEFAKGGAWEVVASLATVVIGLGAAFLLDRRGSLLSLGLSPSAQARAQDWLGLPALARRGVVDPVLGLAHTLARLDDRVVDAGVRAAAAAATRLARLFSWWAERGVDGVVLGVAGATLAAARTSRRADERGVDATVEGIAAGIGVAGRHSRRLQTGLAHHYYVIAAVGVVVAVAAAALGRQ